MTVFAALVLAFAVGRATAESSAKVAFVARPSGALAASPAFARSARAELAALIPLDVVPPPTTAASDGSLCGTGQRGIADVDYATSNVAQGSELVRHTALVSVHLRGCYGDFPDQHSPFGTGLETVALRATATFSDADTAELLVAALNRAVVDFRSSLASRPSFLHNLLDSGVPLADDDRNAFVALQYDATGAHVARLDPHSSAARAGLALGAAVTAIGGTSVSADNLTALVTCANTAGRWSLVAGGRLFIFDAPTGADYVRVSTHTFAHSVSAINRPRRSGDTRIFVGEGGPYMDGHVSLYRFRAAPI